MITPCPKCGKRHERDPESTAGRFLKPAASRSTCAFVLIASLLGAAAASAPIDIAAPLMDDISSLEGNRGLGLKGSDTFAVDAAPGGRMLQVVDEDHDHEGDEDHLHEEEHA